MLSNSQIGNPSSAKFSRTSSNFLNGPLGLQWSKVKNSPKPVIHHPLLHSSPISKMIGEVFILHNVWAHKNFRIKYKWTHCHGPMREKKKKVGYIVLNLSGPEAHAWDVQNLLLKLVWCSSWYNIFILNILLYYWIFLECFYFFHRKCAGKMSVGWSKKEKKNNYNNINIKNCCT